MVRFIDELKSPMVGAYFDTGNGISWTEQSTEHFVCILGRRILKFDIKDRSDGKMDSLAGHFTRRQWPGEIIDELEKISRMT
tara:strand:+ start:217 stop:462 length:246 start_codon:yes stop_codon:yes gene_type:complete